MQRPSFAFAGFLLLAAPSLAQPVVQPADALFEVPWVAYPTASAPHTGSPMALTMADVDGDGDLDVLAARGRSASGFSVLLNDGLGRLSSPTNYAGSTADQQTAWDVLAADFTGDGVVDAVTSDADVSHVSGNTLSFFPGNGDGTFGARSALPVGAGSVVPVGLAAADFDLDGDLDLAVAAYGHIGGGSTVVLLRNDGAGGFAAPAAFPAGAGPYKLAAADVTGDGRPDLVVACEGRSLTVLEATAAGFAAPVTYTELAPNWAGEFFPAVALGDVDDDGDLDALYASTITYDGDRGFAVLLRNDGAGAFSAPARVMTGSPEGITGGPIDLDLADVTGDGRLDLIAAYYTGRTADGAVVVPNMGGGTFGAPTTYAAGHATYAVAAVDLDGDGAADLLTADDHSSAVTVRLNPGGGAFPVLPTDATPALQHFLDAADLDGDGDLDAFTSGAGVAHTAAGGLLMNDGAGRFATVPFANEDGVAFGVLRDLDGDGRPDLLFHPSNTAPPYDFFVALNDGDGSFPTATRWPVGSCGWGHLDAFDLDGDGDLDVVEAEELGCASSGTEGYYFVSLNDGDGTFEAPSQLGPLPAKPRAIAAGDFDEDGHLDLVMTDGAGFGRGFRAFVVLGRGDGTFEEPTTVIVGQGPRDIAAADLDGDGHLDFATANTGQDGAGAESVSVAFGTGDGSFTGVTTYHAPYSPDLLGASGIRVGDADADGDPDLLVGGVANAVAVYLNDGAGAFASPYSIGVASGAASPFWGDFTGDGHADVAVVSALPPLGFDMGVVVLPGRTGAGTPTEPAGGAVRGEALVLAAPYPNPVADRATVAVTLEEAAGVRVDVLDVLGRRVAVLHDGALQAGRHTLHLDVGALPSGFYVIRAASKSATSTHRLVVTR